LAYRPRIKAVIPRLDKAIRLDTVTPLLEEGLIYVPQEAPWLLNFKRELEAFPTGKYDDQVDALSQFLDFVRTPRGRSGTQREQRRYPAPYSRTCSTDAVTKFGRSYF